MPLLPKLVKVKVLRYQDVMIVTGVLLHKVALQFLPSHGVRKSASTKGLFAELEPIFICSPPRAYYHRAHQNHFFKVEKYLWCWCIIRSSIYTRPTSKNKTYTDDFVEPIDFPSGFLRCNNRFYFLWLHVHDLRAYGMMISNTQIASPRLEEKASKRGECVRAPRKVCFCQFAQRRRGS